MKIIDVTARWIRYESTMERDAEGHQHPSRKKHEAKTPFLKITCDDGTQGYAFGSNMNPDVLNTVVRNAILGEDPFYHERIWQKMHAWQRLNANLTDRTLNAMDNALWDICGKKLGLPVYKMVGGYRDKVPAYASIMVGDGKDGELATAEDYARFAKYLVDTYHYKAVKLHTWMPPVIPEPDPKMDVEACIAVREAVGPEVGLMLDPYHFYSREQALYIAKELEKLDFLWLEEPMDESAMDSYIWLTQKTSLPLCGPETVLGKERVRSAWVKYGAADIGRAGDIDLGGFTPLMKAIHLYESFGMSCELHGANIGNPQALGAMGIPGAWYERGLLHPLVDYEHRDPWLKAILDPLDEDGNVLIPQEPGMGYQLDEDYIKDNLL